MGADLYIKKLSDKSRKKHEALFDAWVGIRDQHNKLGNKKLADKAQKKASKYYELMYSEGYYRDSYNKSNLLWLFDLSYWHDLPKLLNKKSEITPVKSKKLLIMLESREDIFQANLKKQKPATGETKIEVVKYFDDKYV